MAVKLRRRQKIDPSKLTFSPGETKIKYKMDITFLNMLICYIFTKSRIITKANLLSIRKFFDYLDTDIYATNVSLYARVVFIKKALECILSKGTERKDLILDYCRLENDQETQNIIDNIDKYGQLSANEIKMVNKSISDRLKYAYLIFYKEILRDLFMRVDQNEFESLNEANDIIKAALSSFMNDIRKTENNVSTNVFTLRDDIMDMYLSELVKKATDPTLTLQTGIRYLNDMLSPGFAPGRLYLWLGITGGYKSSILLQCARWIKLYNKITPRRKEPSATPTVLLISTENSVEETVIRLFNMCASDKPINEFTPEQAIELMKKTGHMTLKDGDTFTNHTKTVGIYYGVTAEADSKWTTITHIPEKPTCETLPKTGK